MRLKNLKKNVYAANRWLIITAFLFSSCDNSNYVPELFEKPDETEIEYTFFDPSDSLNITQCDAEEFASMFMDELGKTDNTFKAVGLHYSSRKTTIVPDNNNEPAVYVINLDPDGFCIVSATKKTETILAYSDQGKFDLNNIPSGLIDWLSEKVEVIQEIKNDHYDAQMMPAVPVNSSNATGGGNYTKTIVNAYGPLLKTKWGQGYPYNYLCPGGCSESGGHCKAGCVAIAAAQIIRYWQPFMPYNFNPYYWNDMPNIAAYISENELLKSNGYYSMARLIHDVGVAVDMDYGCGSSGAETPDIVDVFYRKYSFFYPGSYQELTNSKAKPKVIENIKNKQPVIMRGKDKKQTIINLLKNNINGHCWVCDGYKKITRMKGNVVGSTQELFHMNWGWDGWCDGWFTMDLEFVESDSYYTNSENGKYVYKRGYILGIRANNLK